MNFLALITCGYCVLLNTVCSMSRSWDNNACLSRLPFSTVCMCRWKRYKLWMYCSVPLQANRASSKASGEIFCWCQENVLNVHNNYYYYVHNSSQGVFMYTKGLKWHTYLLGCGLYTKYSVVHLNRISKSMKNKRKFEL